MFINASRQRGLTIIELIAFIVIVGVALVGILTILNVTAKGSADPVIRKQGLAVAEAILEEVMSQPFTWCDSNDSKAATAMTYADCTITPTTLSESNFGPETVNGTPETRGGIPSFDNVNDYNNLTTTTNIAGAGVAPYTASVTVAPTTLNGIGDATTGSAALLITVSVTAGGETIKLEGYRTRYAPNATP
jgi:MSHA pilin protein MshD